MKHKLCLILSLILILGSIAGCAERNADPDSSSANSTSVPSSTSEPGQTPESELEAPSSQPEESYPLPELSDMEREMIEEDASMFMGYFNMIENLSSPSELDQSLATSFCIAQAFRQKDLYGYYFEQTENGEYQIPAAVVAQTAERMLGLTDLSDTENESYNEETKSYSYSEGHGYGTVLNSLPSEMKADADGNLYYDVLYASPEASDFASPLRQTRYVFRLLRMNGMPYLQLVSITSTEP